MIFLNYWRLKLGKSFAALFMVIIIEIAIIIEKVIPMVIVYKCSIKSLIM